MEMLRHCKHNWQTKGHSS